MDRCYRTILERLAGCSETKALHRPASAAEAFTWGPGTMTRNCLRPAGLAHGSDLGKRGDVHFGRAEARNPGDTMVSSNACCEGFVSDVEPTA